MAEVTWPEEQLIAAAQVGDVDAIAAVVSAAHPNIQRFARTLCADAEDAQDAAQEALIILYRKIGMLRATGALASWMFRIVRNECLRRARRRLHEYTPVPDVAVTASAEYEVLQRLEAGRVAAAVAALPPDQRRVLILRDIQGYSGRVAAEVLGIGPAAMKSRLHRARAAVRQTLCTTTESSYGGHDGQNHI
ncbi:RNA polymerase sigma factor [Nocardia zapadnayensis]|uniref:RNA polymerase sigma factor n=1 Tax=Nocardia rhamnosiphila TaxID=426716 RepID=UPI0022486C7B|nr:RNA polymerase sigma factor [Nocardia zapadnayensis]MCX0271717.1 RNA polymerase sigma factor [Nocardia zapadnayensis]